MAISEPMESSTQPSTMGSRHALHSSRAQEFLSESSASDHSFAPGRYREKKKVAYLSTSLVTGTNITLADVIVEEVGAALVSDRIERVIAHCGAVSCSFGIVDARQAFKERKLKGVVDTMVTYDRIEELSRAAVRLAHDFEMAKRAAQSAAPRGNEVVMRHLFS